MTSLNYQIDVVRYGKMNKHVTIVEHKLLNDICVQTLKIQHIIVKPIYFQLHIKSKITIISNEKIKRNEIKFISLISIKKINIMYVSYII